MDVDSFPGLLERADYRSGPIHGAALLGWHPRAALTLRGVDVVGSLDGIAAGRRDTVIDRLDLSTLVPESDGPWNRCEPEAHKQAYRRIVTWQRSEDVRNYATVWDSVASVLGTFCGRAITEW